MPAKPKPRDDYSKVVAILAKTRSEIGATVGHDKWKKRTDTAIGELLVLLASCPKSGVKDVVPATETGRKED